MLYLFPLLLLSLSPSPTHSLILPNLASLPPPLNLTAPRRPPARRPEIDLDVCNSYDDWIGDGIRASECRIALQEMYRTHVVPQRDEEGNARKYEFTPRGVRGSSYEPERVVPSEWWEGTCSITLAMLDQFMPGSLPGEPSTPGLPTLQSDVATYDEIYQVANAVFSQCVFTLDSGRAGAQAGWGIVGEHNSIGVFILREKGPLYTAIMAERWKERNYDTSGTIDGY